MKISKLIFASLVSLLMGQSALAQSSTQKLSVHTNAFSHTIIGAVSAQGNFYSIVCSAGFSSSSADFLFPTRKGDLTSDNYRIVVSHSAYTPEKSEHIPLTETAVKNICNHPNGFYELELKQVGGQMVVDYVSSTTLEADSKNGSRGF